MLCDQHRKDDGSYDVVVPCSGGKDGSYVAHQLKYNYGMNPLCVTWAPLRPTEIGKKNLDNFIQSGFNHILGTPNPQVTRKLTELSFRHLGDPFQPFIYGQTNFPLQVAVSNNISLIMYGENGEVEYGGDMENAYKPNRVIKITLHYFSGMPQSIGRARYIHLIKAFFTTSVLDILANISYFRYYLYWDPRKLLLLRKYRLLSKYSSFRRNLFKICKSR